MGRSAEYRKRIPRSCRNAGKRANAIPSSTSFACVEQRAFRPNVTIRRAYPKSSGQLLLLCLTLIEAVWLERPITPSQLLLGCAVGRPRPAPADVRNWQLAEYLGTAITFGSCAWIKRRSERVDFMPGFPNRCERPYFGSASASPITTPD